LASKIMPEYVIENIILSSHVRAFGSNDTISNTVVNGMLVENAKWYNAISHTCHSYLYFDLKNLTKTFQNTLISSV
jgi:hypothetical protein